MTAKWLRMVGLAATLTCLVGGCATTTGELDEAQNLIAQGHLEQGLARLRQLSERDPTAYRLRYVQARDRVLADLLHQAQQSRAAEQWGAAERLYKQALGIDPKSDGAARGLATLPDARAALAALAAARASMARSELQAAETKLREALRLDPELPEARQLLSRLQSRKAAEATTSRINPKLLEEVTLELSDVSVQELLQILSQTSGINFVLDKDVPPDLRTTIYSRKTTVLSTLDLILNLNQLARKQLSDNAFLIYPDNEEKRGRYEELTVRTFYLRSADPLKVQDMVKTLVSPRTVYTDEAQRILVIRDRPSVIAAVERLVSLYDVPEPEVVLEVEIMELNTDDKNNLGIQYPDSLGIGIQGDGDESGRISLKNAHHIDSGSIQLYYPNPLAVINFQQRGGNARLLANPRIRVSNRQKAKVLIGDKVPVITTTVNQTSSASMESVSYLDVGLKLEVQPEIHINDDVAINVDLEVSNIAKEIRSTNGLLAYQIGTRNATTQLRLKDGETQVLAGLLKDESQNATTELPGLGSIPVLGRLFANKSRNDSRSEIVLQITPHVVRSADPPSRTTTEFDSGTSERASTKPMRLTPAARYSSSAIQEQP